jgi:hypothetical protein
MRSEPDRYVKKVTEESAFGGIHFKPINYVVIPVFQPFISNDDVNPVYDRKEKAYINDFNKYDSNRQNFDS